MEFPSLEQMKTAAESIGYVQTSVAGVVFIFGTIWAGLKWGLIPFRWVASRIRSHKKKQTIERPLRFVLEESRSFWGPAKSGHEEGTQVVGHWHVTNMTDRNVVLLRARVDGHEARHSHVHA